METENVVEELHLLTRMEHTTPNTKQIRKPFTRVPQASVDA